MATNYKFKTYKPKSTSSAKSSYQDIISSSNLKSIENILNEVKTRKIENERKLQYQTDVADFETISQEQQLIDQQEKPKAATGERIKATGKDVVGSLGAGLTGGLESIEDSTINVQKAGLNLWDKIRAGFYDIIGQDTKAQIIRMNTDTLQKMKDIEDDKFDYGQEKVSEWRDEAVEDSYMGKIPRQAFEAVGQMLPAIAISIPIGGAGAMTTLGFQAFGGSSEQALEEGATPEQAFVYGSLSAAVELATEKLVGGGFGKLTGVGGVLDKTISKVSRSALGKIALEVLGEGLEEGIAEVIDPYLKNLTYSEGEKIDWKQVGESVLVGGLSSLIMEGANTVIQKSTKADVAEIIQEYDNLNKAMEAEKIDRTLTEEKQARYEDKMSELESLLQKKINSMKPSEKYKYLSKTFPDGTKITDYAIFKDFDGMGFAKKQTEITSKTEIDTKQTNSQETKQEVIEEKKVQEQIQTLKKKQLDEVLKTNPMADDYHVGIRTLEDVKTFDEVLNDEESFEWGDFSREQAKEAFKKGTITVYSSKDIKNGTFISTSYQQALEYAGQNKNKVNSKEVSIYDVAWINGDEGIMAKVDLDRNHSKTINISANEETTTKKPEIKESKHLETIKEAGKDYFNPETKDMLEMEKLTYEVVSNKETVAKAKSEIQGKNIETEVEKTLNEIGDKKKFSEVTVAKSHLLIQEADRKGMYQQATELSIALSDKLTKLGRQVQAANIINKLTPEGQLYAFRKSVAKGNAEILEKRKKYKESKAFKKVVEERAEKYLASDLKLLKKNEVNNFLTENGIELTKEQQKRLENLTETSNNYTKSIKKVFDEANIPDNEQLANKLAEKVQKETNALKEEYDTAPILIPLTLVDSLARATTAEQGQEIGRKIEKVMAEQKIATVYEKAMQWRYLAMLGNPKTHVRNFVSNAIMREVVKFRNLVSRTIQTVFVKDKSKRTRTFKKPTFKMTDFAFDQAGLAINQVAEQTSKIAEASAENVFGNKLVEAARKFNYLAMEKADYIYMKDIMGRELAEWATAKNLTIEQLKGDPALLEEGKAYAMEQALKATFRDANIITSVVNSLRAKNKVLDTAVGALMPFAKTPVNIARRGFDYSPVSFVRTLTVDLKNLKQGKINVGQFVDKISEGLTGTMITALGFMLAKMGIVKAGSDEKKKEATYKKSIGEQKYSIRIGDKTYTLDWLAPSSIPFFTGVTLFEGLQIEDTNDTFDTFAVLGSMIHLLDPLTEMSFLQSFNNIMSSYDDNKLAGMFNGMIYAYAGQFLPTLFSQISKTIDPQRRITTSTAKGYEKKVNQQMNYLLSKIPGYSFLLEPYVNVWGNEEINPSFENRLMENFAYPFWISENNPGGVDKEILRLYESYGNVSVLPGIANSYYTVDGVRIDMTEKEYTEFKKKVGKFSFNNLDNLFKSNFYKNLTDEEKEKAIEKVYSYARDYAKGGNNKAYLVSKALGENKSNMYAYYYIQLQSIEGTKDKEGNTVYNSKKKSVMNFIESQKLNKAQKHILLALAGYNNTTDKIETFKYIDNLDLSEEQKQVLKDLCSYSK